MKIFKKILIANRGEIAVRVIKSAHKLGIKTVAIYSKIDKDSLHIHMADEAFCIGNQELSETYLNIEKIIEVALKSGSDAIHPGYGFLAESPLLVEACNKAGITFIGPNIRSITLMGNKIEARKFVKTVSVPITEGITGDTNELLQRASEIQFPILVKAAAGGGGKGMRIVFNIDELETVLETTSREAKNYFGDGTVYIEKYIDEPRHIEVQVLGDNYNNVLHLFERECTIQRRYQKIIEESPSPTLTATVRQNMCSDAVKIAKAVGYNSVGTIEFLVDPNMNYYFLEMNTRIQVEHPVTEMVTGIDLVEEQIIVAAENKLRITQDDICQNGHAIESRIYAEDPENNFLPSPGDISLLVLPEGENIRVDTSIIKATTIHSFFDPMICKIIVWAKNREAAIEKSVTALENTVVHGIKTNIPFLISVMENKAFCDNNISTKFCDEQTNNILDGIKNRKNAIDIYLPLITLAIHHIHYIEEPKSIWEQIGYWRNNMVMSFSADEKDDSLEIFRRGNNKYVIKYNGKNFKVELHEKSNHKITLSINDIRIVANVSTNNRNVSTINISGSDFHFTNRNRLGNGNGYNAQTEMEKGSLFAPMPGKIMKINVSVGDLVKRGTILLVVEAMKMENNIVASENAVVEQINVKEGEMVDTNVQLVVLNSDIDN